MIETLYEKMKIPASCRVGKRVFKKLFHENAGLSAADKKALSEDVDAVFWQYAFKPTTIPIQPYEDEEQEYPEVALLQVNLKQTGRMNRLAEIVHRAIPYPLIVAFAADGACSLSLAYKRFSRAEKDAVVAEGFQSTGFLDISNPTREQAAFLESLDISKWPHTHFLAFYRAAMDRVIALGCAAYSGRYSLKTESGRSSDDRAASLARIEKLEQERAEIQNKLKKEKNLGTQVQMNTRIRQIKDSIETLRAEL